MVNESHCLRLGEPAAVTSGNERDPVTVKTEVSTNGALDNVIDPTVLVLAQFACDDSSCALQPSEYWMQSFMDRHREELSRVGLFTFRIPEPQRAGAKIDIAERNRCLRESAPGVQANLRTYPHPLGLQRKSLSQFLNVFVRELGLNFLRVSGNAKPEQGIRLSELPPDSFVHQLRQKFQLKQSRVVANVFTVDRVSGTPSNVTGAVTVFHLTRINDVRGGKKGSDSVPSGCVTSRSSRKKRRNPRSECLTAFATGSKSLFINGRFIGEPLSLARLGIRIITKAGRLLAPNIRVQVTPTEVPEGRPLMLTQMSQGVAIVSHGTPSDKWNSRVKRVLTWSAPGLIGCQVSTITPRGTVLPSYLRVSLTQVSQFLSPTEEAI